MFPDGLRNRASYYALQHFCYAGLRRVIRKLRVDLACLNYVLYMVSPAIWRVRLERYALVAREGRKGPFGPTRPCSSIGMLPWWARGSGYKCVWRIIDSGVHCGARIIPHAMHTGVNAAYLLDYHRVPFAYCWSSCFNPIQSKFAQNGLH